MGASAWRWFLGTGLGAFIAGIAIWLVSLGRDKERIEQHKEMTAKVKAERDHMRRIHDDIEKTLNDIAAVDDPDRRAQLYRDWVRAGIRSAREQRSPISD